MSLLALNLFWGLVDLCFLAAIAQGVRPLRTIAPAVGASVVALVVESGFSPLRFHAMRAASFAIFLHVPLVLVAAAWLKRRDVKRASLLALLAVGLGAAALDAFVYEPRALVTSAYEVKVGAPVRAVVMSDFQAARIGDYERSVLQRIASLDPELVLLAGDYVQAYGAGRAAVVQDFRRAWQAAGIHPKLGVFAVRGDVEPDGWQEEIFDGLGVTTSDETRTFEAGGLAITLLSLEDSSRRNLSLPKVAEGGTLVLGHRPDYALGDGPAGLLVAGHTHGGQVQLPLWGPPLILSAVPRAWGAGGLHTVDASRSLLVTRGAGVEHADDAPPLRFNCRPEIVALDLRR